MQIILRNICKKVCTFLLEKGGVYFNRNKEFEAGDGTSRQSIKIGV